MAVNQKIKDTVALLSTPTEYLRAIHEPEGNYKLGKTELLIPVCINANAGEIDVSQPDNSQLLYYNCPIDVWFMQKNIADDDTGEEIDVILDAMFVLANEFYDLFNASNESGLPLVDDYTLTAEINGFDSVLSGYRLQFSYPQSRATYCPTP
jgi:hypothetical protein